MRGKILNVERKDDAALYKNQEIAALIVALGLGTKGGGNGSSSSSEGSRKGRGSKAGSRRVSSSSSAVEAVATGSFDEGEGEGEAAGVGSGVLKGLRWVCRQTVWRCLWAGVLHVSARSGQSLCSQWLSEYVW